VEGARYIRAMLSSRVVALLAVVMLLGCSSSSGVGGGDEAGAGSGIDGGDTLPDGAVVAACGRLTTLCGEGAPCQGAQDCASALCHAGICQTPTPADGVKDNDETDVDCGGSKAPACADGKGCLVGADCTSGVCTGGICQAPTHTDGVRNGDETGLDCGGASAPKCPTGQGCATDADCDNVLCDPNLKVCAPPSYTDGLQNGDETGVDCGGPNAPNRCPTGQGCAADGDCNNVLCDSTTTHLCLPASHTDGLANGDETGVDCGGPTAPNRCPTGQGCASSTDCNNVLCDTTTTHKCLAPSYTDLLANGDETGVDCGGPNAPNRCPTGQGCLANSDCNNVLCDTTTTHKCLAPSKTDGLKNGTETDIDCGGGAPTNAPKCAFGKHCGAGGDCTSAACSPGGICTLPSCATAETAGITTCGAKESNDPTNVHESCCKSLVLPTRTTKRLDKYEITAGRYRAFLTAVGPDIRTWVANYKAANPTSQLATLIGLNATVGNLYPNADRFVALSLTAHLAFDIDNYNGIRGCYNGAGDYSANTYWMDATHEADFGLPARALSRLVSDEKSLNCAMPMMLAAFCAWDGGGELATLADYHDAWTGTYPWGATDTLRPNYNWCNGPYDNGNFTCQCDGVHNIGPLCPVGGFSVNGEAGVFYEYPIGTDRSLDNEPLIAAPGRMVNDATVLKSGGESWMDLYANLAEYTGDFQASTSDFCDFSVATYGTSCTRSNRSGTGTQFTNIPRAGIIGRTWEGHNYGTGSTNVFAVTFQYGKFGGRCVRPATKY
jgi:hypothetical protein